VLAAASGAFVSVAFDQAGLPPAFPRWWVSDALSILMIAPLVLAWSDVRLSAFERIGPPERGRRPLICFATADTRFALGLHRAAHPAAEFHAHAFHRAFPGCGAPCGSARADKSAAVILHGGDSIWDTMHRPGSVLGRFRRARLVRALLQMFLIVAA